MVRIGPALAVAIVLVVLVGTAVAWVGRTGHERALPWASIRAAVQLVGLALVIGAVVDHPLLVAAFVAVMVGTASWAAARRAVARTALDAGERRARPTLRQAAWCAVPVAAFPVLLVAVLLVVGVVPSTGLAVIPVAGILLGNAMAIVGLAGRRAGDELTLRHGEVEAAMALGFTDTQSRLMVCREAAATSLGPSLDQTRTIGLVTIPGAFVGMVLGGAQPWEAGVMQLFVSTGILAAGVIALVLTTLLVADGRLVSRPTAGGPTLSG